MRASRRVNHRYNVASDESRRRVEKRVVKKLAMALIRLSFYDALGSIIC